MEVAEIRRDLAATLASVRRRLSTATRRFLLIFWGDGILEAGDSLEADAVMRGPLAANHPVGFFQLLQLTSLAVVAASTLMLLLQQALRLIESAPEMTPQRRDFFVGTVSFALTLLFLRMM